MRVAFATTDLVSVNAHLGWTPHLLVYEVTTGDARPVDHVVFPEATEDGDHAKLAARLEVAATCAILYAGAVGPSAAAQLAALRVRVVQAHPGEQIAEITERLARVVSCSPPPWLAKLLRHEAAASPPAPGTAG